MRPISTRRRRRSARRALVPLQLGPVPADLTQVFVLNHTYELPFGPKRKFLNRGRLAQVAGNRNINGLWSAITGQRVTPLLATSVSNSSGGGDRHNHIADGNLPSGQRTIDNWYNLAAFVPPAQFTFENAGTGILVGPGTFNVDLGIHRDFPSAERFTLSYRCEMFNAFNRANFGPPKHPSAARPARSAAPLGGANFADGVEVDLLAHSPGGLPPSASPT